MFNGMPDSVAESGMTLYAEPAWNCVTLSTEGSRGSTWRDTTPSRGVCGWMGGARNEEEEGQEGQEGKGFQC